MPDCGRVALGPDWRGKRNDSGGWLVKGRGGIWTMVIGVVGAALLAGGAWQMGVALRVGASAPTADGERAIVSTAVRPAPDVELPLLDGGAVRLSDLRGGVVLLNFWATWCPPCRQEMPDFQRVWEARGDDGFTVLGVSTDAGAAGVISAFLEREGITYPVARSTLAAAAAFGGVELLPTSYLIDAEGRIRHTVTGVFEVDDLVARVDALLAEAGRTGTGALPAATRREVRLDGAAEVGHVLGSTDAPVTVVEFSDYGCVYCAAFDRETFPLLHEDFIATGRVRWIHVPFLLGKFPNADVAMVAAACVAEQDPVTYWPMRYGLFRRQREWRVSADPIGLFTSYARDLGLDAGEFGRCVREVRPRESLVAAQDLAYEAGVGSTPTFFIDGRREQGAIPVERFRALLARVSP